jgi:hypothetical protein
VKGGAGIRPQLSPGKWGPSMSLDQKRARIFGVLFLITFATSIPALVLYETVLRHPVSYIAGAGHDKQVLLGALLELLLIASNIGTAVVIFPILRRQNEELEGRSPMPSPRSRTGRSCSVRAGSSAGGTG